MKTHPIIAALGLAALSLVFTTPPAQADSPTMFGVNLSGGDFKTSAMPGALGTDYFYPSAPHIDWAKSQGLELVRMPFRWERVQYETNGVLSTTLHGPDIDAIDAALDLAEARGLRVILDMHNYAARSLTINGTKSGYKIGTTELPVSAYANVWQLLADHFKDRGCIWGYDIMNEPNGVAVADWVTACQAVVNAIRTVDTKHAIVLEGVTYAHTSSWATTGAPLLAVTDPANNLIFEGHCYVDRDQSGTWSHGVTVSAELVPSSYATVTAAYQVGVDRVKPFVDWCVANNVRGLVGEYGSPSATDTANWNVVLDNMLAYMKNNGNGLISGTQWGGGGWNGTYVARMESRLDNSNPPPVALVLPTYASGLGTNYWSLFTWYDEVITTTADYTYPYSYASTSPAATCTFNIADTTTHFSGAKSVDLAYTVPGGGYAGAGMHIRGPLSSPDNVGGVDISKSVAAGHVLSFYAQGTVGANPSVTLGTTSDSSGLDSGSDTGVGNWISLNSIKPLTATWQRYEIPLSAFLNSSITASTRVQRLRFAAGPADGASYDVHFDKITIGAPSTNTAPAVTVDTSTSGSTFTVNTSVGLVATASDADSGDAIDYVEFYADGRKVGVTDTPPYTASTTFTFPGTYPIRAIAFDSHGAVGTATKTLTIVQLPPAAPTGLSATAGYTQVALSWTASADTTSYNIKRATTNGGPYTTVGSVGGTSFIDSGLTNGVAYCYVVSAMNPGGEGVNSSQVSATPSAAAAPFAPTGLNLLTGDTQLYLSWTTAPGASSYNVKRASSSGGPYTTIASVTTTSFTDPSLINGTSYYYVISAVNANGESADTNQVSGVPQAITIIQDNTDATGVVKTGGWAVSTSSTGYYGSNYWHDGNNGATGGRKVTYTPAITTSGYYDVYARWVTNANRATNVPIDINSATGTTTVTVNQQTNNGVWVLLGRFQLNAGAAGSVVIRNDGANGYVIADAIEYILR
ncbi:MAG TPA: cellulase family glycosylhydrolase [Opitutaceae bacterium]|nr:cellulase family glycosylhydrolase [Opitutaceae bacterium]